MVHKMWKSGEEGVAEDFYPFVGEGEQSDMGDQVIPRHPARIAVYDDASAAPRVVEVAPRDVRAYLEEITLQVTQLSQAQGGTIPFMVIREIVENLIHAYFIQPTVSILDHGNTIRFSDQGPGIREKDRALQYGTTSATEEMRRYIRGVGSGLPYVQQYMMDKGGSLRIEDNMAGGTVVTISAVGAMQQPPMPAGQQGVAVTAPWQQQTQPYAPPQPYQPQAQAYAPQPYQQQAQTWGQPVQQPQQWPAYQQISQPIGQPSWSPQSQMAPQPQPAFPPQGASASTPSTGMDWVAVSQRGQLALDYLRSHDSVGPSDLSRALGGSQPTWTRELQDLENQGLILKDGQKRRLTAMGRAYLGLPPSS